MYFKLCENSMPMVFKMEHLSSLSTVKLEKDECELSLKYEVDNNNDNGELTNTFEYYNSLMQAKDLLIPSDKISDKVSSASVITGENIYEEINTLEEKIIIDDDLILFDENDTKNTEDQKIIIDDLILFDKNDTENTEDKKIIIDDNLILFDKNDTENTEDQKIIDDDLILFDESDTEELYEEFKGNEDEDYKPEEFNKSFDYIPLEYKARTVALAEAHPKWSLETLHKKGCSRLKKKTDLKRWKEDVKKGGTHNDKRKHIDTETFNRIMEARASHKQVTNQTIQQLAMTAALPYISKYFIFNASKSWVNNFKRKHRIKQRKIIRCVNKKDCTTMEEIEAAEKFQSKLEL